MTIAEALFIGSERLRLADIDESRREAASLLAFVLAKTAVFLIAHPEYVLTDEDQARYQDILRRRSGREPFHYIIGRKEFYGLDFHVEPGVLIPRPETELLVESVVRTLGPMTHPKFLEIGVGSGCISVSVLFNLPTANAVAVDLSERAISVSAANAHRHHVGDRLRLIRGDIFDGVSENFDLIVSNPPYIPDLDLASLQPEVSKFEPHEALFGGQDGLSIIRRIINGAPRFLKPGGSITLEIGFGQADAVAEMFRQSVWSNADFIQDLQGINRIVTAVLRQ